jgi:hypothetical protein
VLDRLRNQQLHDSRVLVGAGFFNEREMVDRIGDPVSRSRHDEARGSHQSTPSNYSKLEALHQNRYLLILLAREGMVLPVDVNERTEVLYHAGRWIHAHV